MALNGTYGEVLFYNAILAQPTNHAGSG